MKYSMHAQRCLLTCLLTAGLAVLLAAAPALAQSASRVAVVRGEVLDAVSGRGLPGASVRLIPEPAGETAPERLEVTGVDGAYRFERVLPGRYVLRIERLGYRESEVRVEVPRPGEASVSVGLELDPIALEALAVRGAAGTPYDRALTGARGAVPAVRLRQQRYLATDVRGMTHGELLASVTMGETDLFRALHRLPSVSTRDDWSAELWTRNAAWDQTRVTLDGLPLFSPLHGGGLFGAVNPDAVGAVYLHPGVRPAGMGEGGAAVLELQTRPGSGPKVQGFGELSPVSARLAIDRRSAKGGWMMAARRTYLDWLTQGLESQSGDGTIPYHYTDLTARVDRALPSGATLEASGAWIRDRLTGSVPDVLHGSTATWGDRLARLTLGHDVGGLRARHTLGVSSYRAILDTVPVEPDIRGNAGRVAPLEHGLTHVVLRGELGPEDDASRRSGPGPHPAPTWDAGYELIHEAVRAVGAPPSAFLNVDMTALDRLDIKHGLTRLGAWYERRWRPGSLEIAAGLRAEAGTRIEGGGPVRLAPRLQLRWAPSDALVLGAGIGRAYQYVQSPVPVGLPLGVSRTPLFPAGAFWLLASDSVPALRTDAATIGGELWMDAGHLLSLTVYGRTADGVLVADPRPGRAEERPLYVVGDERALGVETSFRRLEGRLTGSVSYALARATQEALGFRYAPASDRRHTVDLTGRYALTRGLAAAAAFTYATGSPYTRVVDAQDDPTDLRTLLVQGEPNARRMPAYASLDLSLEWMTSLRSVGLGVFVQVRNALNRRNTAGYGASSIRCADDSTGWSEIGGVIFCEPSGEEQKLRDDFLPAMPRAPLLGFRLRF